MFRKRKNISVNKLSKITGISLGYISDLENNKANNPTTDKLKTIADALNVSVEAFFNPTSQLNFFEELGLRVDKPLNEDPKSEQLIHTFDIIPEVFTDPSETRYYISKHKIFSADGFDVNKLSDDEVLEFGNTLLEQMKMVSYKYKK